MLTYIIGVPLVAPGVSRIGYSGCPFKSHIILSSLASAMIAARFPSIRFPTCLSAMLIALILVMGLGCGDASLTSDADGVEGGQAIERDLPTDAELHARLDAVLKFTLEERSLSLEKHAAWQILHGVLAYGADFEVLHADRKVPALQWVLDGGHMDGWSMRPGPRGVIADLEQGSKKGQGHPDQWLAVISQCELPSTQPIEIAGRQYQLRDLLTQAMFDVYEGKECSWTIIALSEYLRPEDQWTARDGSTWDLERIIAMEAGAADRSELSEQAINESACGGSHRLIGMTMALRRYQQVYPERPLTKGWQAADERIRWAVARAREYQLPTGAFSVQYFARPGNASDLSEHLGATGHTLEFLSLALSDKQIAEPWVVRAADYLCELFELTRQIDLECGALYHAAHGLALYRSRRFGEPAVSTSRTAPVETATGSNRPVR